MGSPVARRTRGSAARAAEASAAATGAAGAPGPQPEAVPAQKEAGTCAGVKRPREPELSEDDYSCPVCLSLLVDPVVGSCGHDLCELCFRRWTVDQGKTSCPACRQTLAAQLPGICHRLKRTIEALFPERLKERQAEVAEQRQALAAEKRARDEARRRSEAAQRQAAVEQDLLLHAVLEQLLPQALFGHGAGRRAAAQQQAQQQQAAQQAAAAAAAPPTRPAAHVGAAWPPTWPPTQQQQAGRLVQRRYPTQTAVSLAVAAQSQAEPGTAPAAAAQQAQQQQQQAQQQQGRLAGFDVRVLQGLQTLVSSLLPGSRLQQQQQQQQAASSAAAAAGAPAAAGAQQQQEQQHAWAQQQPQPQPQPRHYQVQVFHITSAPVRHVVVPPGPYAAQPAQLTFPVQMSGPAAGAPAAAVLPQAATQAWPMGPPLHEMQFNMGWHGAQGGPGQARRRGQPRSRR